MVFGLAPALVGEKNNISLKINLSFQEESNKTKKKDD